MIKVHRWNMVFVMCLLASLPSCVSDNVENQKGFAVSEVEETEGTEHANTLKKDSLSFETRPVSVLNTGLSNVRLTALFKLNYRARDKHFFTGELNYHYSYNDTEQPGNSFGYRLIPGYESVYGYNFVNVAHFAVDRDSSHLLFDKPVLIRTLYYPSFETDTLNFEPVHRNNMIVTAYNEDTNRDGFITTTDLRRLFVFDENGESLESVVPKNHSVFKSEYDSANDRIYLFAYFDQNGDGIVAVTEPVHVFWMSLRDPSQGGVLYE